MFRLSVLEILVYYEAFLSKSDALREEKFLKSGKGKERVKYLFKDNMEECRSG